MRAIRVTAPGAIELAEIAEPRRDGQVVVRVDQVGICGTDTKIVEGKIPVRYPRVLGHEMVGEIVSAPSDNPYPTGTRVLVDPGISCGWCDLCHAGRFNICRNGGLMGRDVDGVFTEYTVVPFTRMVPVPAPISDRAAGLLQVLGTCVHAVKALTPFPGRVAAVIGLGVAGQLISQLLTRSGMTVVGITRSEWKRELAAENGAAAVAAPDEAAALLADITAGRGPNLVVEAVGREATLAQAIDLAGTGGQILVYGTLTEGDHGLPYYHLYHKELTLHNPRAAVMSDYADGVALATSGAVALDSLVTHELALEEAAEGFDLVHDASTLKVLLHVSH